MRIVCVIDSIMTSACEVEKLSLQDLLQGHDNFITQYTLVDDPHEINHIFSLEENKISQSMTSSHKHSLAEHDVITQT